MILDAVRFDQAIARFDALNMQDPSMQDAEDKAWNFFIQNA
jgi:hypothetical protein